MISVFNAQKAYEGRLPTRSANSVYPHLAITGEDSEFPAVFEGHTPPDAVVFDKTLAETDIANAESRIPPGTNRRLTNRPANPGAWKEY